MLSGQSCEEFHAGLLHYRRFNSLESLDFGIGTQSGWHSWTLYPNEVKQMTSLKNLKSLVSCFSPYTKQSLNSYEGIISQPAGLDWSLSHTMFVLFCYNLFERGRVYQTTLHFSTRMLAAQQSHRDKCWNQFCLSDGVWIYPLIFSLVHRMT